MALGPLLRRAFRSLPLRKTSLTTKAVLFLLGGVGMTAWGRSHKFWICGGEQNDLARAPLQRGTEKAEIPPGIYGLAVWAILCISVLVSEVRKGGRIQTDRFFNASGWDSKAYVYLLGWQYSTIASGVVSRSIVQV